jgi:hypothetical protein
MDGFIWVFGTALIVILIVYFLPLGLTKKGKVILVTSSFLLALGGIAATSSFSFLLSLAILVVLIVFVTYLLDQRLGKWLYSAEESFGEPENDKVFLTTELQTAASLEKNHHRNNEAALEPLNFLKDKKEKNASVATEDESKGDITTFETGDDDISFLLNRSITLEKETSTKQAEQKLKEVDYLSEIEELLNDNLDHLQTIEIPNHSQNSKPIAYDDHEIPVFSFEDKPLKKKSESNNGQAKKIEDFDEIPVLPFHESEGDE